MSKQTVDWNRPLLLAMILTLIGGGAVWLEYSYRPKKEDAELAAKKLFPLKDAQVAQVQVFDGSHGFTFHCLELEEKLCKPGDNAKWELTEPVRMRADDANVNALVSSLNNLSSSGIVDLKEDPPEKRAVLLNEYGLSDRARATAKRAEVKTAAGPTYTVWIGDLHPMGDNHFALTDRKDDQVELIPAYFSESIDHDLSYWRDKKIVTLTPTQIKGFEIRGSKGPVKAVRGTDGTWKVLAGKTELQGDIENVDNLISTAVYTNAKGFASEQKGDARAKRALVGAKKSLTFTFEAESGEPVTLTFFSRKHGPKPKLYATASNLDPLYEIDPNMLGRLDKSAKDLRLAKLITSMDRFSIRRIEFKGGSLGDKPLVAIQGADGKWTIEGASSDVSAEKIQTVLDRISGNRIRDFVPVANQAKGQQQGIEVTLSDGASHVKRKIVFWKTPNALYAHDLLGKHAESYLVDPAIWSALPSSQDFFNAAPKTPEALPTASEHHEGPTH